MFDLVHKNKRIIQVVLALLTLPFAFFGIDSYFRDRAGSEAVASFDGQEITQQEFSNALRERQDMLRNLAGGRADQTQLESAELRFAVLDDMIRQRLMLQRAVKSGMTVSEKQLQGIIAEIPAFQENGKFSYPQYERLLKSQNMTPVTFEARVRQQIVMQQIDDAFADSNFIPRTVAERVARIAEEQREVSHAVIPADRFAAQVKLEDDAARKYYEGKQDEFRVPEQVRVDYVTLSAEELVARVKVDPAEVKKFFDEHRKDFEVKESRQASHILVMADPAGGADAKAKAKARADELYKEVKAKPDSFAELARKHSQDPGSAAKGGDLGFFPRGAMVKAFDDAVFAMKQGETSLPVESEFGYHIIRLTGIRAGRTAEAKDVSAQIEAELRKQLAAKQFAEYAEKFSNIVFEQSESLKPAAEAAGSPVRQSGWITRTEAKEPVLNQPRVLQAIFSDETLNNKRNTEAVEAGRGVLVAARIIEHKPATVRPFEDVQAEIVKKLTQQRAAQLAAQEGRETLENVKQGKAASVNWSTSQLMGRGNAKGLPEVALRRLFKMPVQQLPAYAGVEGPDGQFYLLRVTKVVEPEKVPVEKQNALAGSLEEASSQAQMTAFVEALRRKADVKIKKELIEKR